MNDGEATQTYQIRHDPERFMELYALLIHEFKRIDALEYENEARVASLGALIQFVQQLGPEFIDGRSLAPLKRLRDEILWGDIQAEVGNRVGRHPLPPSELELRLTAIAITRLLKQSAGMKKREAREFVSAAMTKKGREVSCEQLKNWEGKWLNEQMTADKLGDYGHGSALERLADIEGHIIELAQRHREIAPKVQARRHIELAVDQNTPKKSRPDFE